MVYTYCGTLYFYLDYRLANEPIKTNFSEYMDTVTYSQRLSRGDITSIELVYNSDRKEEYHISIYPFSIERLDHKPVPESLLRAIRKALSCES